MVPCSKLCEEFRPLVIHSIFVYDCIGMVWYCIESYFIVLHNGRTGWGIVWKGGGWWSYYCFLLVCIVMLCVTGEQGGEEGDSLGASFKPVCIVMYVASTYCIVLYSACLLYTSPSPRDS